MHMGAQSAPSQQPLSGPYFIMNILYIIMYKYTYVYIITTGGRRLARNTRPPMAAPASTVPPKQQSTRRGNQRNGGNVCPSNFPPSDVLLKSKSSRLGKQLVPHVCRRPSITAGPAPFGIATINPAAATTEGRVATRGRDGNRVLASPSRGGGAAYLSKQSVRGKP